MQWNVLLFRVAIGLLATVIMDLGGGLGFLLGIAYRKPQRMGHYLIGRWVGYMFRGKFRHIDILTTPCSAGGAASWYSDPLSDRRHHGADLFCNSGNNAYSDQCAHRGGIWAGYHGISLVSHVPV